MKKSIIFFVLIFFTNNLFAWTINNSLRRGFSKGSIRVVIGSDNCTNAGITTSSLHSLVKEAMEDYWNTVPTSSLKLEDGGISSISLNGDTTLTSAANKTDVNTIIVGCNDDITSFSASILGVGGIGCTGDDCRGAVVMNDSAGSNLASADRQTIITALSHELGHAIGLGHSSVNGALMYYSLSNKTQKSLSQDDMDGVTYLYPNEKKLGGLAGACGTVSFDKDDSNGSGPFLMSLVFGLMIIALMAYTGRRFHKKVALLPNNL